MTLMVFDIGGTEIKYCLMDETLSPRGRGSVPTPKENQEDLFRTLFDLYAPHREETEGIAISMPGFIDSKNGLCNGGGALLYNHRTSIASPLSSLCGCPVHIANDGKCAAYAELAGGALKGVTNGCVYIIGTGVGGGLVVDGKIVNGSRFTAGEFSFLQCDFEQWGSVDNMTGMRCSTTGLLAAYRQKRSLPDDVPLNGKIFFSRVSEGEEAALQTLDAFAADVAKSIANITILLDLEKVAVGGGISRQPVLIETIESKLSDLWSEAVARHTLDPALAMPAIVQCHYTSDANMVGAYLFYKQ